jgi:hypothetical protein
MQVCCSISKGVRSLFILHTSAAVPSYCLQEPCCTGAVPQTCHVHSIADLLRTRFDSCALFKLSACVLVCLQEPGCPGAVPEILSQYQALLTSCALFDCCVLAAALLPWCAAKKMSHSQQHCRPPVHDLTVTCLQEPCGTGALPQYVTVSALLSSGALLKFCLRWSFPLAGAWLPRCAASATPGSGAPLT